MVMTVPHMDVLRTSGSQDISTPLAAVTDWNKPWKLSGVYLKFSAAVTETFTVTLDSKDGTSYDCVFKTEALTGATSASYVPTDNLVFGAGDEITVGVTSATATGNVFYTILGIEC